MYSGCECSRPIRSSIFQSKSTLSSAPTINTALHGGDNIFKYNIGFSAIITDLSCFNEKKPLCIEDKKKFKKKLRIHKLVVANEISK